MPSHSNLTHDVVIAGAGPVGLLLACELRLAGCSVLVLEQALEPHSALKALPFGLRGLSAPTLESLDRRGLLEPLQERTVAQDTAAAAHWIGQRRRPAGHFAGIQFYHDQVDDIRWPFRSPGPVGALAVEMASLEAILQTRAEALGATIQRGCKLEGLTATGHGVVVYSADQAFLARWLVGCDGGRSTVRKLAGFAFAGTDPEFTGYSVQADLAGPGRLQPGRRYTLGGMYTYTPPDVIGLVEFDGGAFHRKAPITREHIQAVLRRVSGEEVTITALKLAATWTDRAFQADVYQRGRVLLAGDAAHVHSPLGGQGLNLGLGDAMNLGWKLAAAIRGDAPADLLETYERERRPIGAQVLDWSRAQVSLMRPDPSSRALEGVIRDLIATSDGAAYFAERVWGLGLRYDVGQPHPLAGRSAPDFQLSDGSRLNELLRAGRGVLLDFGASAPRQPIAARWADRLAYVACQARDPMGLDAVLVRPDGVVAWAADPRTDAGHAPVEDALVRWLGDPGARP